MKKFITPFILFFANLLFVQAQEQKKIDSLLIILKTAKEDTVKVKLLNEVGYSFRDIQPDTGLFYCQQAMSLARKLGYKQGLSVAYNNSGVNYLRLSKYYDALENYEQGFRIDKELDDEPGMAVALGNMGNVYLLSNNFPKALGCYLKALKVYEKTGDESKQGIALGNMGLIYMSMGDYKKALDYMEKELTIHTRLGDKYNSGRVSTLMGTVYAYTEQYQEALERYREGLRFGEETGNRSMIASCIGDIGTVYGDLGDYGLAIRYQKKAIPLWQKLNNTYSLALQLRSLGTSYGKADDKTLVSNGIKPEARYTEAMALINQSIGMAQEIGSLLLEEEGWRALIEVYESQGKYRDALAAYKRFSAIHDSLLNDEKKEEMTRNELQYEFDKEQALQQAEQEKKDILARAEIRKQKNVRNSVIAIGTIALFAGSISFRFYKRKRDAVQKEEKTAAALRIAEVRQQALNAQMSDHFIGNAMDSINNFIECNDRAAASRYLIMFQRLTMKILDNSFKTRISLQEELDIVREYIELEKLRFPDGALQYEINTSGVEDTWNTFIPPMVFQVLAENALKHGFRKTVGGKLKITAERKGIYLHGVIEDNGIGRKASLAEKANRIKDRISHGGSLAAALIKTNDGTDPHTYFVITDLFDYRQQAAGTRVTFSVLLSES